MNIGERATALAHQHRREEVLARATGALQRMAGCDEDELVPGQEVAWLLAAAMVQPVINGGAPRVVTRTMDDGVQLKDGIG